MVKYTDLYIERIYNRYYYYCRQDWEEEIFQIMWEALFESLESYKKDKSMMCFEVYAEKVITENVERWISENGHYDYRYVSLDKPFRDSGETMLSTYISAEDTFCSYELYDFISRLSFIKYVICKSYILRYCDEEITRWLGISSEQLDHIKIELQQDFRQGYFD